MTHSKPFIYNPAQKTKEQLIAEFVVRKNIFEKILEELKSSQKDLITHKQYNFLLKFYKEENSLLMKHASPIYYVLAYFMKKELPGVYEKAGSEIKETVDEIIKSIENEKEI